MVKIEVYKYNCNIITFFWDLILTVRIRKIKLTQKIKNELRDARENYV